MAALRISIVSLALLAVSYVFAISVVFGQSPSPSPSPTTVPSAAPSTGLGN